MKKVLVIVLVFCLLLLVSCKESEKGEIDLSFLEEGVVVEDNMGVNEEDMPLAEVPDQAIPKPIIVQDDSNKVDTNCYDYVDFGVAESERVHLGGGLFTADCTKDEELYCQSDHIVNGESVRALHDYASSVMLKADVDEITILKINYYDMPIINGQPSAQGLIQAVPVMVGSMGNLKEVGKIDFGYTESWRTVEFNLGQIDSKDIVVNFDTSVNRIESEGKSYFLNYLGLCKDSYGDKVDFGVAESEKMHAGGGLFQADCTKNEKLYCQSDLIIDGDTVRILHDYGSSVMIKAKTDENSILIIDIFDMPKVNGEPAVKGTIQPISVMVGSVGAPKEVGKIDFGYTETWKTHTFDVGSIDSEDLVVLFDTSVNMVEGEGKDYFLDYLVLTRK